MKYILMLSVTVMALSQTASATGMVRTVYDCRGGAGEAAASFTVKVISTSPPGGPVSSHTEATASNSWLGGTHYSGIVHVTPVVAEDGGPENYFNKDQKFALTVAKKDGQLESGRPARVYVRASFVDPKTGMKGSITPRWIKCQ